jgi:predicted metal-dependent hydrolase
MRFSRTSTRRACAPTLVQHTRMDRHLTLTRISEPAEFRAAVIVHELLHRRIHNHGPLFRASVQAYLSHAQPAPRP